MFLRDHWPGMLLGDCDTVVDPPLAPWPTPLLSRTIPFRAKRRHAKTNPNFASWCPAGSLLARDLSELPLHALSPAFALSLRRLEQIAELFVIVVGVPVGLGALLGRLRIVAARRVHPAEISQQCGRAPAPVPLQRSRFRGFRCIRGRTVDLAPRGSSYGRTVSRWRHPAPSRFWPIARPEKKRHRLCVGT